MLCQAHFYKMRSENEVITDSWFVIFLTFIFETERERESEPEWGRGREREGDTESEAGSRL